MGPHGLEQAYLHRPAAATPRQAPRRPRGRLDGQRGVPAARTPGSRPPARTRRWPGPRPSLHRPRHRHPRLPAPPAPARRPRRALRGGPLPRPPKDKAKAAAGSGGRAKESPDQAQAPPLKPKQDAPPEEVAAWDEARHRQSSERICVEHANAEHKQWRTLQRYLGRREDFDETYTVIAVLVSDRAAER